MKVSLLSLGCKVNQSEMSQIEAALIEKGHMIVGLSGTPSVCVINTCSVTARSDYQSRQLIRRAARTGARVVATGCYCELNPTVAASVSSGVEVVRNSDKYNIINMIDGNGDSSTALKSRLSRTRFFHKVQDGCDHCCSYCVIPQARGKSRSIDLKEAVAGISRAEADGYKEVVLTGIHLGLYGLDFGSSLCDLIEGAIRETKDIRIRLSSLEATEINDRLLDLMKDERVCGHLHIPLQSGDDGVLSHMNRPYDMAFYEKVLEKVVSRLGNIAIGTDIIAGFPSETDDAFKNTLDLADSLPFTYMHVFPYSRRPSTPAADMSDSVGSSARKERAAALRELSGRKSLEYMKAQVGRKLNVLVEGSSGGELFFGTSDNYLKIHIRSKEDIGGTVVPVGIEGIIDGRLSGKAYLNHITM